MKLPADAKIAAEKTANYLLRWRPESDKSQFLALAGYTETHGDRLTTDIRQQLLVLEAKLQETTEYGKLYRVDGTLTGPNGRGLRVTSIWIIEAATGETNFVTLFPAKES